MELAWFAHGVSGKMVIPDDRRDLIVPFLEDPTARKTYRDVGPGDTPSGRLLVLARIRIGDERPVVCPCCRRRLP